LALSDIYIKKIFDNLPQYYYSKITININLNPFDFYKNRELEFLKINAMFLYQKGIKIIISTMLDYNLDFDYVF